MFNGYQNQVDLNMLFYNSYPLSLSKRFRDRSCFQKPGGTGSDFNPCCVTFSDLEFIDRDGDLHPGSVPPTYEYPGHSNSVADAPAAYANPDAFAGSANADGTAVSDLGCAQKLRGWRLARGG
jgi:hypothetical protein